VAFNAHSLSVLVSSPLSSALKLLPILSGDVDECCHMYCLQELVMALNDYLVSMHRSSLDETS